MWFAILLFLLLPLTTDAQCSIPAPLSNGAQFVLSTNPTFKVVFSSPSGGVVEILGTNYTLACDGAVGLEYYGRFVVSLGGVTAHIGYCFLLRTAGTTTVQGFQWRTNLTSIVNPPIVGNVVYPGGVGVSNPVSRAVACNAGGDRPEYENDWLDITSGSFTPPGCPTALRRSFNYTVNPGATCAGSTADGLSNTNQLSINTAGCTATTAFFNTAPLTCLHGFTANGNNYIQLRNGTGLTGTGYCMMYSVSGNTLTASIQLDHCYANQTATILGVAWSGILMNFTFTGGPGTGSGSGSTAGGSGTGSGSSAPLLSPSIFLLTILFFKPLFLSGNNQ